MDYYKILRLSKNASVEEIIRSFRLLAKQYHPDLNNDPNAKQKFIEIFEAYTILKDKNKREKYDDIVFGNNEDQKHEPYDKEYREWKEEAADKGTYYSNNEYKVFSKEVLEKLKEVGKFSGRILYYFGLLILCGIISSFIIRPIMNGVFKRVIQNDTVSISQGNVSDGNNSLFICDNDKSKRRLPLSLPLPLKNWKRIYIENVGTIDIPPTMEVQSGVYKEIIDPIKMYISKSMGTNADKKHDIIIQQKGLNDLEKEGFAKYARVMISTNISDTGDYDSLTFDINKYSTNDVFEINNYIYSEIKRAFNNTAIKLIKWFPLRLETINGMSCVHISYIRQLNNNPNVVVNIYEFQNIDRMYTLDCSYRENEKEYWGNDFNTILNSFRIENLK